VFRQHPDTGQWQRGRVDHHSPAQYVDDDDYAQQMKDNTPGYKHDGLGTYYDVDWGNGGNELTHQRHLYARRTIAASDGFDPMSVTTRLHQEFNDWATPLAQAGKIGPYPQNLVKHWPYVERFMKEKYPAAHNGFDMGHEEARPAINRGLKNPEKAIYETGPDAVEKYGYDPMETAAGMVLLHGAGGPTAGPTATDTDRERMNKQMLNNIYRSRARMQRQYEEQAVGGASPNATH
jgi:hypothetical protein